MPTLAMRSIPESPPEHADAIDWRARARLTFSPPSSPPTGSKRACGALWVRRCHRPDSFLRCNWLPCVFDVDGNEYVDCTMALGSVALGPMR